MRNADFNDMRKLFSLAYIVATNPLSAFHVEALLQDSAGRPASQCGWLACRVQCIRFNSRFTV